MIKKVTVLHMPDENSVQKENINSLHYLPGQNKISWQERLSRNLALSGICLLTILAIRNAQLPNGETVLTAVQQIVDQNWDDNLGKISFVSNFFPESAAVFFETEPDPQFSTPCFGEISHAWSINEPYISYKTASNESIYSIAAGRVMTVAHSNNDNIIIRITHDNGLETLYYDLDNVQVQEGDHVTVDTCIGTGKAIVEVRQNGLPIDPTKMLSKRTGAAL